MADGNNRAKTSRSYTAIKYACVERVRRALKRRESLFPFRSLETLTRSADVAPRKRKNVGTREARKWIAVGSEWRLSGAAVNSSWFGVAGKVLEPAKQRLSFAARDKAGLSIVCLGGRGWRIIRSSRERAAKGREFPLRLTLRLAVCSTMQTLLLRRIWAEKHTTVISEVKNQIRFFEVDIFQLKENVKI